MVGRHRVVNDSSQHQSATGSHIEVSIIEVLPPQCVGTILVTDQSPSRDSILVG